MTEESARSLLATLLSELAAAHEQLAAARRVSSAIPKMIEGLTWVCPGLRDLPEVKALFEVPGRSSRTRSAL